MPPVIAYDLCRLFIGPCFATPRGIDRVDLAVANQVFADLTSPHVALLPTPLGARVYTASAARRFLDQLHYVWGEVADTENDQRLSGLIADMHAPAARVFTPLRDRGLSRRQSIARWLTLLRRSGWSMGEAAVTAVPQGAVYINLGQLALAVPMFFTWLNKRPDVACAMMIHDTIPLDHPELVKPASVAHHARMIRTAALYADGLIFSTEFARATINAAVATLRRERLPGLVRSLPVPAAFAKASDCVLELADKQYFVAVSTIEPRKNFTLLLTVWARLIERLGPAAPHLVIVGAWGRDAEAILAPLARSAELRSRVHQVSGLSSPTLARLMGGCAAVLSPSLIEGFGLPLLEGIAMGAPTIASDIPSHREIARGTTTLLDSGDIEGWEAAIVATPRAPSRQRSVIPADLTEAAYFSDIAAFIGSLAPRARNVPVARLSR